jgi:hypothetical protein
VPKITREGISNALQSNATETALLQQQGKHAVIFWPKVIRPTG